MHNIIQKLNTLEQESGKLAKVELLKDYLKDEKFRIFIEMTLDETLHYNIKKLPQGVTVRNNPDFWDLIDYLIFLSKKQGANMQEKRELASFCVDDDWEKVIIKIINKDLKCGVGPKLINKAVPGSITIFPYLGCCTSKKKQNLNFPAYCQEKEDGLFVNIFHAKNKTSYFTRNGNELVFPEDGLKDQIIRNFPKTDQPLVYMGELRIRIDGKYLPRKTGNGIVNKALKKNQTMSEGESLKVHFICWDVVPETDFWLYEYARHYSERFNSLNFLQHTKASRCHLVKTKIIDSFPEAQEWAQKIIADKGEGVIVKNFDATWSDVHSTVQIKLKAGDLGIDDERECELKVIDWYYGKEGTKFENCLGGLVCSSEDCLLETNIGGGFSEQDRGFIGWTEDRKPIIQPDISYWISDRYVDEIITAGFNEVIKAKTSKKHSLFSGRFKEIRHDRKEADTLEKIKEQ